MRQRRSFLAELYDKKKEPKWKTLSSFHSKSENNFHWPKTSQKVPFWHTFWALFVSSWPGMNQKLHSFTISGQNFSDLARTCSKRAQKGSFLICPDFPAQPKSDILTSFSSSELLTTNVNVCNVDGHVKSHILRFSKSTTVVTKKRYWRKSFFCGRYLALFRRPSVVWIARFYQKIMNCFTSAQI